MGGPGGVGLGNNMPPIVNYPGVGNVGNVGGVQQGGALPNVPPVGGEALVPEHQAPPRAADVVGQLDVLLLKALNGASGTVDAAAVEKAAKAAKLPKADIANLKSLAADAQSCLKELDRYSGRDLAAAMTKNEDGTVAWKDGAPAAEAFANAQEAQEKLSSALAKALGSAKNFKTQATLEELMLQCDRRSGELESLVLQMTEIIDAGGANAVDDATKLVGSGTISSHHSGADALDKFGRGEMFNALKDDLKPLTDRLESYAKDGYKNLTKADVEQCVQDLNAIKNKFSAAAASGQIEVGGKTVFIDRSLLAEATKLLGDVGKKIGSLQREVVRAAMDNFVEKDIPFLDDEIFSPKFADELHELIGKKYDFPFDKLKAVLTHLNSFRSAARAYVASPTKQNATALKEAAQALADEKLCREAAKCLTTDVFALSSQLAGADDTLKNAFMAFRQKILDGKIDVDSLGKSVRSAYKNMDVAADRLIGLGKELNAKSGEKCFVSSAVLDVFKGEMSLSTLLESRVHGYEDSDVNIALDDKNVVESKSLGSGNFNTVTLVKVKDGSEWVFKPELAGRLTAPNSALNDGLDANQEMTRVNLAVQTTADTLGLGDVMVKTSAGTHKGQFGMFMEKAPGVTGRQFKKNISPSLVPGKVGVAEIDTMDDAKFAKVVGRMMRQFNRMQWFDTLTAQGDRHSDNYMIDINGSDLSVSIKAIDNDASYGIFRQGLHKFSMPAGTMINYAFGDAIDTLLEGAASEDDQNALVQSLLADPGIKQRKDGSYEIDLEKSGNPALLKSFFTVSGMRNVAPPDEIDRELYDKLVALAKNAPDGGKARADYLASLADRLGKGSESYKAAVRRLDESIAHARKLHADGKVYSAEQWEDHDVQRKIAVPNLANMDAKLDTYNITLSEKTTTVFTGKSHYVNFTNSFFRDMYDTVVKGTSHKNWFDS